ncbi:MAG: SDR family oxidoreductase [Lachnospiraceae bacterium]|nr:SDR family oxidoreductase [Lachnospiraceae bacterium]
MKKNYMNQFSLKGRVCIITGGGGLIGMKHAEAVMEGEGIPVLLDIAEEGMQRVKKCLMEEYGEKQDGKDSSTAEPVIETFVTDITKRGDLEEVRDILLQKYGHIDALINNAANNPKVEGGSKNLAATKFPDFPVELWNADLAVGLTGAMLCAQVFGGVMEQQEKGVIINISSDYGLISPDQRVYRKEGIPEEEQIIKPVSYSVVKHGIIGLTKYLATYWAKKGIRVNTLCPASLANGQDEEFVKKLSNLIPMGRMSDPDEYVGTVLYMLSEASSYMTGATVVLDGGRTSW